MSARPSAGRAAVLGVALALGGAWHAVLILVFLVAVLWADEIAHASARALSAALGAARERARQRRELDRRWLELARQGRPVPSAHEHPEDVRDLAGPSSRGCARSARPSSRQTSRC